MNSSKISPFARLALLGLVGFVLAFVLAPAVTAGDNPIQEYAKRASAARVSATSRLERNRR